MMSDNSKQAFQRVWYKEYRQKNPGTLPYNAFDYQVRLCQKNGEQAVHRTVEDPR